MTKKISEAHPPRHQKFVVMRGGYIFTATPCYGLHDPWWVVLTMDGEAPPMAMQPDDEWCPLTEIVMAES